MDNLAREHILFSTFRLLYLKNKGFIVPFLIIVVVLILYVKITIPSIQDLLIGYEEQKAALKSLDKLKSKLNFVKNLDNTSLSKQYNLLSNALPIVKDFNSIFDAISNSSNKSNVAVSGYRFIVGNISKEEVADEYPALDVTITLIGGVEEVKKFMSSLSESLPLSEITNVSAQKDTSKVEVSFYYKFIEPSKKNDNLNINPISKEGLDLIDKLSKLNIPQDAISEPVSSSSANPFF